MEIISISLKVFKALSERVETAEAKAKALYSQQGDATLQSWLDHQDVCQILSIGKRTLQSYRANGTIPYCQIGHKIFYKPEDVQKLLEKSHHPITDGHE